jgi:hypothetical protein
MTERPNPALNAPPAIAAKPADQRTSARTTATPDDRPSGVQTDWPDPGEFGQGLEVQYLDDDARDTYFGDLDPSIG